MVRDLLHCRGVRPPMGLEASETLSIRLCHIHIWVRFVWVTWKVVTRNLMDGRAGTVLLISPFMRTGCGELGGEGSA